MSSNTSMRPECWEDYIGQTKLKSDLQIRINAAVEDGRMLDHILMIAPPGYGKTSLASLIAIELGRPMESFVMPMQPTLMRNLFRVADGVVLFFDEFHRIPPKQQENLLTAIEDGVWQEGLKRFDLAAFTLIAATTEGGSIIPALQRRFKIRPHFVRYSQPDMADVARRMARKVNIELPNDIANRIGAASAGSPSQVEDMILAARDLGSTNFNDILSLCNLTTEGLRPEHIEYLQILDRTDKAGLEVISSSMQQSKEYVMGLERVLDEMGFIERTPRGRQLSHRGFNLVKKKAKALT